jgi:heme-degrading monooxygenase HmoA
MTFVRIWRTRIDLARLSEYERFVEKYSQPMFASQSGFLGVIFSRDGDEVAVLSFWRDLGSVSALEKSTSYQSAAESIGEAGFLTGEPSLDVYEIHAGSVENLGDLLPPGPT